LSGLLEKIILEAIGDRAAAAGVFESGIHLMQEIADSFSNTGRYDGGIRDLLDRIAAVTGAPVPADGASPEAQEAVQPQESEAKPSMQILDEALTRDFIAEGLEYIEEIEINILNLENEPENKDYINAIFRPFHSIKGVASFLNLETIRALAHDLESLRQDPQRGTVRYACPDRCRAGRSGRVKTLIGRLRDVLEGKAADEGGLDIPALTARIHRVEQGFDAAAGSKKIGEILVEDGEIFKEKLEETLKISEVKPDRKIGETLIEQGVVKPKQVSQALRKQMDQVTDLTTIRVDTANSMI
jgi:two-component system chemotaxis sensor kinase CheA